ncbi:hypothetical protein FY034_17285 (plasmid) [Trichlorobacter lovleyi]|uniref:hypothetical protein n=1 Tax=Trichlorobacter lovleyi TaxID=313985 RepID=UPI00223F3536|nr:hypothetical protein [Trichlorobacter lovleyi]QOX80777.1 hypothetical protein FY034_17285 [Trichlorobacter lovleyi]
MSNSAKGGDVTTIQASPEEKPKGILDALSELEYYYTQELKGAVLDGGFFTTKQRFSFLELGFRSTFVSSLITALMTPVAIGVVEKMVPVFGSTEPNLFDTVFVFMLTLSYLIGYAFLIGRGSMCFFGEYTHQMVKNLVGGVIAAAVLKMGIIFILFHFIYLKIFTPEKITSFMLMLGKNIDIARLEAPYKWLLEFRPVFLTSAYFVVLSTILFVAIISGCYFKALVRNKKIKEATLLI